MNFNGRFYNKPGHLGMTRAELKEALQGGGGGYDPDEVSKLTVVLSPADMLSLLGGTAVTATAVNYDKTKFQPYMTVIVTSEPDPAHSIFYAVAFDDSNNARSKVFASGLYVDLTSKTYFVSATLNDPDAGTFTFNAAEL